MTKKIYGSVEVTGNLQVDGKYAMRFFNSMAPDANTGDVNYQYYSKEKVDNILKMLPISRVGTMDYMPINVGGDYVGASSLSHVYRLQPINVEDDGSVSIIRSGTNGSTRGFYYAYVSDIRTKPLTDDSVTTTTNEFRPQFFTPEQQIDGFIGTNGYELLCYQTSLNTYVLTLTNGTFSMSEHESVQFPKTVFGTDKPTYALIVNDLIYIWCIDTTLPNSGLGYVLYTVPVSGVRGNDMSGLTKVTAYSGTTVRNLKYNNSTSLRVYDRYMSVGTSTDSLYECTGSVTRIEKYDYIDYNIMVVPSPDGTKMRVAFYPTFRAFTALYESKVFATGISFVYDISTKTMTLDKTPSAPITAYYDIYSLFQITNPYDISMNNTLGSDDGQLGNCGSICQTGDGLVVSTKSRWVSSQFYGINKYNVSTPLYDSWNLVTRRNSNRSALNVKPIFGSAVGENMLGVKFIDRRKILLACAGTDNNGNTFGYDSVVATGIGNNITFPYDSVESGNKIYGFPPQDGRELVSINPHDFAGMVSLVEADGTTSAYGSSLVTGTYKRCRGKIRPNDYSFQDEYFMEQSVMNKLNDDVIKHAGLIGITSSEMTFYYVPDSSFSKSIAAVSAYNSTTKIGYIIVAEVDVTLDGNDFVNPVVFSSRKQNIGNLASVNFSPYYIRFAGLTVAKYNGFNYIGVGMLNTFTTAGGSVYHCMVGKIKNGTMASNYRFYRGSYLNTGSFVDHGVIPEIGFGLFDFTKSDYQTKSVFALYGTTELELDNLIAGTDEVKQHIVIASQEVSQGWNVYISQEVPVFLGGVYHVLPPQHFNLEDLSSYPPHNQVFKMYVELDPHTKIPAYRIINTTLEETLERVYIGSIVTNAESIDSITMEKVTRFLTYRPSTVQRGSAIPCSGGVPSSPGTRWK